MEGGNVGARDEWRENQRRASKPSAPELDRRNRESGLNQAMKVYPEAPAREDMTDGAAGFYYNESNLLVARGYKNGVLSEIVGVVVP